MNKIDLEKKIFSHENIYAAIYALHSYIQEPNLLSQEDYNLYCNLKDKYNKELIQNIINECSDFLSSAYRTDELFSAKVYFKLKGIKNGSFTFRPIHTCDLRTYICLVAMLQPIMFCDTQARQYSHTSQMIPGNFYGNRPSTQVDYLYQKWQKNYKEYSDLIIEKSREYSQNGKYAYEVSLDLKDFFPSVSPSLLIHILKNKCKSIYKDCDFLEKTLIKLLYFKLSPENINGWESIYYPNIKLPLSKSTRLTTRGIPQGLPQAPFFGNIFMERIAETLKQQFDGDALFYVDDSIIFTNANETDYNDFIKPHNYDKHLNAFGIPRSCDYRKQNIPSVPLMLKKKYLSFQKKLTYEIHFHDNEKSYHRPLSESSNTNRALAFLRREVSMAGALYSLTDEYEDSSSLEKVRTIRRMIEEALNKLKTTPGVCDVPTNNKLKLLKRHLRFFKFRERILLLRKKGVIDQSAIDSFVDRFLMPSLSSDEERENYMSNFDEDIFHAEYRLILNNLPSTDESILDFLRKLQEFEESIAPKDAETKFLYFKHDANGCHLHRYSRDSSYDSLKHILHEYFGASMLAPQQIKEEKILSFIDCIENKSAATTIRSILIPEYAEFVASSSTQYIRKIFNTACSLLFNVEVSDRFMICKDNTQPTYYNEFRALAYLRNRNCNISIVKNFIKSLFSENDKIVDTQPIDMSLVNILGVLVRYVREANHIDNIIQTHRKVSSLWKNGSKFLNDYTLHNEDHAICLIRQCVHLCNTIDYLQLKQKDFYLLFLACYLHDISMVLHPNLNDFCIKTPKTVEIISQLNLHLKKHNGKAKLPISHHTALETFRKVFEYFEQKVRDNHAKDSAVYIQSRDGNSFNYIENADLHIIAEVALAHGAEAESVYLEKSKAHDSLFSLKYMKILIRLADLMDMCSERISFSRMQDMLVAMSPVSRFHWISHLFTQSARVETRYTLQNSDTHVQGKQAIHELIQVNIYLKGASLLHLPNNGICNDCHLCTEKTSASETAELSHNYDCMKICSSAQDTGKSDCPMTCLWFMKKNKWLFNEFSHLKEYLNDVNSRIFETDFEINYFYKNNTTIPPEMIQYIKEQL